MNRKGTRGGSYSRTRPLPDRIENLLRYYIECLRQDEGQPIRAWLNDAGKRFIPWPFPSDLSCLDDAEPRITLDRPFADELRMTSAGGALLYGYPMYIEVKGGYASAAPLFIWPIEYELNGRELWPRASTRWPQMDPEYLKKLAPTPEEQRELLNSLGLIDTTDDPPVGLILDLLKRMKDKGLLLKVLEPLDPQKLSKPERLTDAKAPGLINCAALFSTGRPPYTAGLIDELQEMVESGAPGWASTAFATMLGEQGDTGGKEQAAVEVVPLNEEQRTAVERAISSPLTAVTGPPGTGKSQIVVSMIADAYIRGRRVLFASKNNKAVDVVEARVAELASNPLMVRTGGRFGRQLTQSLVSMLALRPSPSDHLKYEELRGRCKGLQGQESDLWAELQGTRKAHDRLLSLDKAQSRFEKEYTAHEWERIQNAGGLPNIDRLTTALQLTNEHIAPSDSLLRRLAIGLSASRDRKRIRSIAAEAMSECSVIGAYPLDDHSWQAWRTWLARALSVAEALSAVAEYRDELAALRELRTRDEVARELRRVRNDVTDSGAELVALYARLAPDRLNSADRQAMGNLRTMLERLAGNQLVSETYPRRDMIRLFRDGSRHIPAWCVTNLSARGSLPLEPNLFDLLIIDESSQCDIPSALPLLYRSKRAVLIGDPLQLRHITQIERLTDWQLQAAHGLGANQLRFTYSENSLYDLSITTGKPVQLQDHYRSHSHIVDFSKHQWYQGNLQVWTDYGRLKAPPDGKFGICWTETSGAAKRPRDGSVFILSEVEAVVEQAVDLLMNLGFDGTVGVVTPFRAQANMIRERVAQRVSSAVLNRAQLIVDTAHGFQGDERDIVLFSPCVSRDLPSGAHTFLKNTENLFNVAITRARSLLHVVGSRDACADSEIPHIQRFTSYCEEIERSGSSPYATTLASDERIGPWEKPLYDALVAKGLNPIPQHPVNQYRLDLAIVSGEIRIDVEADGESTHLDPRSDAERDSQLENLGWRVVRFWNHQIRDDIDYCVQTVLDLVDPSAPG